VVDAALVLGGSVRAGAAGRDANREDLLEAVFAEHYGGFCRLATLLLGDGSGAEEVVQEAFLRTFSSWWRVRQPERAQWYVRAAVVNLCRSRLRRRSTEEAGNRASWRDPTDWSDDAVEDALVVLEAVRTLPPRQRETVVLRYYEDLSERDVATVLGCSVGTVKSQLARARASLARSLAPAEDPNPTQEATDAPD
jgi:RNA polymerase sigma-70 factor (sigma-E family)